MLTAWINVTAFTASERAVVGAVITQIENERRARTGAQLLTQAVQPVFFQAKKARPAPVSELTRLLLSLKVYRSIISGATR